MENTACTPIDGLKLGCTVELEKMGVPGSPSGGFDSQGQGCALSVQSCNVSPGDDHGQPWLNTIVLEQVMVKKCLHRM